jgi:hypothetical protein
MQRQSYSERLNTSIWMDELFTLSRSVNGFKGSASQPVAPKERGINSADTSLSLAFQRAGLSSSGR